MTIKGLFEKGIYNVFYFLGSIFSVYISEHINKICAMDPQTKSPAFRKIKFTAAFRFTLTISHTFHLIYSSAFQQLQGLTGAVSSSAGTEDIGYIAVFLFSDLCLQKFMCIHSYLNIQVLWCMWSWKNDLFSLVTFFFPLKFHICSPQNFQLIIQFLRGFIAIGEAQRFSDLSADRMWAGEA